MHSPFLDEKLIQIKDSSHDFAQMLALPNFCHFFSTTCFVSKPKQLSLQGMSCAQIKNCCQECRLLKKLNKCVPTVWDSLEC